MFYEWSKPVYFYGVRIIYDNGGANDAPENDRTVTILWAKKA